MSLDTTSTNLPESPKRSRWQRFTSQVKRLWNRLDLLTLLTRLGTAIQRWVVSSEGKVLLFFGATIGLSIYGIAQGYVRLTAGMGLFWLLFFLLIFIFAQASRNDIDSFDKTLLDDIKLEDVAWYVLLLNETIRWLIRVIRSAMNTIMAIAVSLAYIVTEIHLGAATGDLWSWTSIQEWTWLDALLLVVNPVLGISLDLWDSLKETKSRSPYVLLFGVAQFYLSGVILFTGLIGGQEALLAIHSIVDHPFQWLTDELPNVAYRESRGYQILTGIGAVPFVFFYFLLPMNGLFFAREEIKAHRNIGGEPRIPLRSAQGLLWASVLFMTIVVYVSWQQGWILAILGFILMAIQWVVQTIAGFFA